MQVSIKDLSVSMDIKNSGITLDVYDNSGSHLGDLVVTKTRVVWCPGKTQPENGHRVAWADFIKLMEAQPR